MIWESPQQATVFVVGANRSDYGNLARASLQHTEIVCFSTGREALQSRPNEGPTLWVLNWQLPDMSGLDLQAMLRSQGRCAPIALVGDVYRVEDEIAARRSGADMYFVKPVDRELLMAAIQ